MAPGDNESRRWPWPGGSTFFDGDPNLFPELMRCLCDFTSHQVKLVLLGFPALTWDDGNDIAQELVVEFVNKPAEERRKLADPRDFKRWMKTAIIHAVLKWHSAQARFVRLDSGGTRDSGEFTSAQAAGPNPWAVAAIPGDAAGKDDRRREAIDAAALLLPDREKDAWCRVRMQHQSHAFVAGEMKITSGTVAKHVMNGDRKMAAALKPFMEDPQ